jgi:tryptophanyl-tRNA synthetase
MSSSIPDSIIGFNEPDDVVRKKVMAGLTGGRMTLAEQKEMGGEPDQCPIFLLNLFHMVEDDRELSEIRSCCMGGQLMCGKCKKDTVARVLEFLHDFQEKMERAADRIRER